MAEVCTQSVDTGFAALGYAKVSLLGVVQGITELLPISSTAHMRVVPALLGWQDPGSAFSAAMQLAALAAVVSYFWSDVRDLTVNSWRAVLRRKLDDRYFRLSVWIILATVPIGLAGLALAGVLNACGSPLRTLGVIGWACVVMAVLLAFAEVYARHKRTIAQAYGGCSETRIGRNRQGRLQFHRRNIALAKTDRSQLGSLQDSEGASDHKATSASLHCDIRTGR